MRLTLQKWGEDAALQRAWADLACRTARTPFCTPEWVGCAVAARGGRVQLAAGWQGSDLAALWPHVQGLGARSFLSGPSDSLALLAEPGFDGETFFAEAAAQLRASHLDLPEWPASQPLAGFFAQPQSVLPFIRLGSQTQKGPAADARRTLRRADIRVRTASADSAAADFEVLCSLHAGRWLRRGLPGSFRGHARRLHALWLPGAIKRGEAELLILEHSASPIGALYLMHGAGQSLYYQSGWAAEAKHLSPGSALILEAMRRGEERGSEVFSFGRGLEPYKARWGATDFETNVRLTRALTPLGHALLAYSRPQHQAVGCIKRRFEQGA